MMKTIKEITDYIFIGTEPCKADAIFVVGGSLPDAAELTADLYNKDYAKIIIIGGKLSIKRDSFPLPDYETEYDFYKDILLKNGVKESDIYGENESGYTKQNAEFAKRVVNENNLIVNKAMIVCKSFHAKRCLLLYQMYFPNVDFTVVAFDGFDISKDNWYQTEYGRERVIGEIKRIEEQL
ncbi:MAG: YdcF family protein [Eubacterium sp.]|nr:YdcF family protein [Eubacterium sp.]